MSEIKTYKVQCECGKIFDIRLKIDLAAQPEPIDVYCPFCDELNTVNIPGAQVPTGEVTRGFKKDNDD